MGWNDQKKIEPVPIKDLSVIVLFLSVSAKTESIYPLPGLLNMRFCDHVFKRYSVTIIFKNLHCPGAGAKLKTTMRRSLSS
jgi:hypothetical protein